VNTTRETRVAIIGAGAIGCSIAYHLAVRGTDVTVVEGMSVGAGTSSANLGLVWVQGKEPAPYMELNLLGARLHAGLAPKFDEDIGLRQPGGLTICMDEVELEEAMHSMERLNAGSRMYQARALTPAEVRELEPCVSSEVVGGVYTPHDGHINPNKLVFHLERLARRNGAHFVLGTPVSSIAVDEAGVFGVRTSNGLVRARIVVVAAGVGSPALIEPLGFKLPLRFDRGQILITAQARKLLHHPTDSIRQTEEGNILIGTTHEDAGLDTSTTSAATAKIARNALRTYPVLKNLQVIRQFAGIRPMPADGKPYLGPVDRFPGLYVAVSHSGITLSVLHGKVISELILDGKTDVPIGPYRPERYAQGWPPPR
jgi:glycine/D-amino acid oxidase-like deaminating enzyme